MAGLTKMLGTSVLSRCTLGKALPDKVLFGEALVPVHDALHDLDCQ